jgi:hypothetical protein
MKTQALIHTQGKSIIGCFRKSRKQPEGFVPDTANLYLVGQDIKTATNIVSKRGMKPGQ